MDTLLALLNSTPVIDGTPTDELGDDTSAREWLRVNGIDAPVAERQILRDGRDLLQSVVRGDLAPQALAPLLEGVTSHPQLADGTVSWVLDLTGARAVVVEAVLTWDRLHKTRPGRLRPCANEECNLFLLDRSKSNSGRWCSMSACGNKLKARRHYQRARNNA